MLRRTASGGNDDTSTLEAMECSEREREKWEMVIEPLRSGGNFQEEINGAML